MRQFLPIQTKLRIFAKLSNHTTKLIRPSNSETSQIFNMKRQNVSLKLKVILSKLKFFINSSQANSFVSVK